MLTQDNLELGHQGVALAPLAMLNHKPDWVVLQLVGRLGVLGHPVPDHMRPSSESQNSV